MKSTIGCAKPPKIRVLEKMKKNRFLLLAIISVLFPLTIVCFVGELVAQNTATDLDGFRREVAAAQQIPLHDGDVCVVSGNDVHDQNGIVFRVRGRRVPMMKQAIEEFRAHPEKYFSKLQARGGLFSESFAVVQPRYAWFFFGVLVTLLLISGGLAGSAAIRRGLNPGKWFFAGLFGNIFSFFQVRGKGEVLENIPDGLAKIRNTADPISCPKCTAENHPSASSCATCSEKLVPVYESEKQRV